MKKKAIKFAVDGFKNILKSLGGDKDPRVNNIYVPPIRISQNLANDIYTYNWMAAKCIDIPVDDSTRKWRKLLIEDDKKREQVEEVFKEYDIKGKVNIAMKWARAFGGSAIIFMFNDEDPAFPLNVESIKQDSLSNIIVLDRYNIIANEVNRNILDPNFGQPETYYIARTGDVIHHTRMVVFQGYIPTIYEYEKENYWGLSYFNRGLEPVEQSMQVSNNINTSTYEANIDVYRIEGLNSMVAEGQDDLVVKRLQLASEMKSAVNGIALDKQDEYDKKGNTFTDLANIDDRFIQKVAGCWNIPVTRLMGISPAGQNATGESDMLNYYDNVQSVQENELRPLLNKIDALVMASGFGDKEPLEYKFLPLKQLTEQEQADVDLKNGQRDQIYLDGQVITKVDVISELSQNGTYSNIDANRVEEEKKEEEETEGFDTTEGLEEEVETEPEAIEGINEEETENSSTD